MPDLAPLRRADPPRLARRVRREVVMVQVTLAGIRAQGVDHLLHPEHVQRGNPQNLGLAPLEQGRAVHPRDDLDLSRQAADVGEPPPVDAHAVAHDPLPHQLLRQRPQRRPDLLLPALEPPGQLLHGLGTDAVELGLPLLLRGDTQRRLDRSRELFGKQPVDVVLVVDVAGEITPVRLFPLRPRGQPGLGLAQRADERLGRLQPLGDNLLRGRGRPGVDQPDGALGRLRLDHHDRNVVVGQDAPGHDHVERRAGQLGMRRERHPLTLDVGDASRADRAAERQAGELSAGARRVDGDYVVEVVGMQCHDGRDDLDLVAQPLAEAGPQRTVGQPAGQDRVLAGTALTPEERAGNLAGRIHPLLDVDGEREEVEMLARVLRGGGGRQHHGVVVERHDRRAGRLPREPPGLEMDSAGAERAVVEHRLGCDDVWTLHRVVLLLIRQASPPGRPGRLVRYRCSVEVFGTGTLPVRRARPKATTEDRRLAAPGPFSWDLAPHGLSGPHDRGERPRWVPLPA